LSGWWIVVGASLVTAVLTAVVRSFTLKRGVLDVPNARSSHSVPTPRGGGVAIAATCLVAWAICWTGGLMPSGLAIALIGGGLVIALVGMLDDYRSLTPGLRFSAHALSACWALYWTGGLPPLQIGGEIHDLGIPGEILGVIAIVWVINLFNFMDGIDGLAASETAFVAAGGGCFALLASGGGAGVPSLVLAAACLGFLVWNWPPARIFMGDAGSGFLGFALAVLALGASADAPAAPFLWLMLAGCFFIDATVTLLRRLLRRARVYQAHREHGYQWLARRWRSHLPVDVVFLLVNLLWLAPLAWYASEHPARAAAICALALVPLIPAALLAGAGRPE
jgi:Fuc2NAc and GlcNAc transferase